MDAPSAATGLDANSVEPIRVKLLSRFPAELWLHQCPDGVARWGRCDFLFDPQARDYDWLVVYDDIPPRPGEHKGTAAEALPCPAAHSILVTTEPASIKTYGRRFTRQFGAVLTSQPEWALPHAQRIFSQPALHWFYGVGTKGYTPFRELQADGRLTKSRALSMVFSPKRQRHTLHHRRFDFMRRLMTLLPEMDVYGRGARPLDDKAEALDAYRYHVAIENYVGPHHWTEKLADAFLGLTLPFYCGCTNAADYFPPESFIPIDMKDPEGAARIIRQAIADHEYEKRLPAIQEARRRVLYEHNLFAVLSREIEKRHDAGLKADGHSVIYSRHALRKQSLVGGVREMFGKARARLIHMFRSR
jgi:hypothetical protein